MYSVHYKCIGNLGSHVNISIVFITSTVLYRFYCSMSCKMQKIHLHVICTVGTGTLYMYKSCTYLNMAVCFG